MVPWMKLVPTNGDVREGRGGGAKMKVSQVHVCWPCGLYGGGDDTSACWTRPAVSQGCVFFFFFFNSVPTESWICSNPAPRPLDVSLQPLMSVGLDFTPVDDGKSESLLVSKAKVALNLTAGRQTC